MDLRKFFGIRKSEGKSPVVCKDDQFRYASEKEVKRATKEVIEKYRYDLKELAKH